MLSMIGSKVDSIPMPAGVADLFTLIGFLQDPKRIEAHLKKVQAATDNANKAIQLVGAAKKIPQLLKSAEQKAEQAQEIITEAQKKAEIIVNNAVDDARIAAQTLKDQVSKLKDEDKTLKTYAAQKTKELKAREQSIAEKESDLTGLQQALGAEKAKLDKQGKEIERKIKILNQL